LNTTCSFVLDTFKTPLQEPIMFWANSMFAKNIPIVNVKNFLIELRID